MNFFQGDRQAVVSERDRQAVVSECDRQAVDNRQRAVRVARRPLESFLRRATKELRVREAGVTVCLVSDAEIARLNETFRKKKGPTDVLSFPPVARRRAVRLRRSSKTAKARDYLGDIAISPATARRYAGKNGRKLSSELRVLILHGLLHLLGYDHETDRGEMDRVERKLRKRLGLA
jgi:probable rRNA maturation factor